MWAHARFLDTQPVATAKASSGFAAARTLFAGRVAKGSDAGAGGAKKDAPWTKHHGAIMDIRPVSTTPGAGWGPCTSFSTAGIDGRVVTWDFAALGVDLASVGLA